MESFTICVIYKAKSAQAREEFLCELASSGCLDKIRAEDGCLKYEYYFSTEDNAKLVLFEEWRDKECQKIHMTQPHMSLAMQIKGKYIESATLKEIKII
ncbi:MAG: antibiotic biosynthesis monooxygenase [Clostridia bacterium]|nr:antibiotic biosynthesis monooxygenase [Clostridia bacterium]